MNKTLFKIHKISSGSEQKNTKFFLQLWRYRHHTRWNWFWQIIIFQLFQEQIGIELKPYIYILFHGLAMSHACYNPIIYCYMNTRFRDGLFLIFKTLPCLKGYYMRKSRGSSTFQQNACKYFPQKMILLQMIPPIKSDLKWKYLHWIIYHLRPNWPHCL